MQEHDKEWLFSVAPMMDWTDRHCRYFHRLLSPHARLYTEMVTTGALIHGDSERFLRFDNSEHPVAIQLGGNDPSALAHCAEMAAKQGYNEVNLNCGCPSDRVQSGQFGACLMAEPALVASCIKSMQEAVDIPVTVKCRIGIDDSEDYQFLEDFIKPIADIGCNTFIIHARKAWLKGLSPKENRDIPPLQYDIAQKLKENFPNLRIILNGGLKDIVTIKEQLPHFDGVMIGREAYSNPMFLAFMERALINENHIVDLNEVVEKMAAYAYSQKELHGTPLKSIARHMTGLFAGRPGAKYWRQQLALRAFRTDTTGQLLIDIWQEMQAKAAA